MYVYIYRSIQCSYTEVISSPESYQDFNHKSYYQE